LRWIFEVNLKSFIIESEVIEVWLPLIISAVVVILFLRRRIQLLNLANRFNKGYLFYQLFIFGLIALPFLNFQKYISRAFYKLEIINSISEIDLEQAERYYKISTYEVDQLNAHSIIKKSGRYNTSSSARLYIVAPLKGQKNDRENIPYIWYATKYQKEVNLHNPSPRNSYPFNDFLNQSLRAYDNRYLKDGRYFINLPHSEERTNYVQAIKRAYTSIDDRRLIILLPKTNSFDERFENHLFWFLFSLVLGTLLFSLMVKIPSIDEHKLRDFI